ncbi:MAG TPA: DedA family protein [Chloroflexota bacterium]|nr:DedA family protein [Chloroflexota bacterium]
MIEGLFSLSTHTLQNLLDTWGYLAVFVFVAIESSGIPFPGETMLITAAVYAGTGHLHIVGVIAASSAGAITGDNIGYWVGRTGGRELALRYGRYIRLDEGKLAATERFFVRHGDKTVFFGRFIAVLRAWAAFLAGVNRMPWWKFAVFNAAGGIAWSTLYGVLAFELGKNLPLLHRIVAVIGYGGLVAVLVLAIVLFFLHRGGHLQRFFGSPGPAQAGAPTGQGANPGGEPASKPPAVQRPLTAPNNGDQPGGVQPADE